MADTKSQGLNISLPPQLLRRIHSAAAERMRRGERGGVSATVRELISAALDARPTETPGNGA